MKKRESQKNCPLPKSLSKIDHLLPIIINIDCIAFVERNMTKQESNHKKGVIDILLLYGKHPAIFGLVIFMVNEKYLKLSGPAGYAREFYAKDKPDYLDQGFTAYYWEPTKKYYEERERVYLANMEILPETCASIQFHKKV